MIEKIRERARTIKLNLAALVIAYRDPRTPWVARIFAGVVIAYAFSPIDLIPDFIPVLGYLDDLVLVPLGILLAIRMIPPKVMEESRLKAEEAHAEGFPVRWLGAVIILLVWAGIVICGFLWAKKAITR